MYIHRNINDFINENKQIIGIVEFCKDYNFKNKKTKQYLYHGTSKNPKDFKLIDDWNGDSGNTYVADLPEGYLFLTDDIKEAKAYGRYIIPCEFKAYSSLVININGNNPSQVFDDDFSGYGDYGMWSKFMDSGKHVLQVKGYGKSTYITSIENIIPRTDISIDYYKL